MPELFGNRISHSELEQRVGSLSQVAGVRMMTLQDGPETGVRIADLRTGSGLRFQVSLDRGMDISAADFKGTPLAWRSPNGDVHPSYFDPRGMEWTRTFPGGLMTGCGLTTAGAASTDDGEELGLHGRLSHTPATQVETKTEWSGDRCTFILSGLVRENALFKHNLILLRKIEADLGSSVLTLYDTVVNEGFRRSPFMLLYHINLGWPLVDDGAALRLHATATTPRDAEASRGTPEARKISTPVQNYKEQVFYHDVVAGSDGFATVMMENERLQLGLYVRYRQKELPRFTEWKMVGEGEYVVGLEPANCRVEGRAKERERGTLQFLDPGERRGHVVQIGIVEGKHAIHQFKNEYQLT